MEAAVRKNPECPKLSEWLCNKLLNQSWAVAIREENFGIIADWFATYFFMVGFIGLLLAGIAAGLSGVDQLGPETRARDQQAYLASHPESPKPIKPPKPQGAPPSTSSASPAPDQHAGAAKPAESWQRDVALGLRVFSLGVLLSGAATSLGWFFGLLFGIPKSSEGQAPSGTDKTASGRQTNTNLMDISDWLTKTIVGVGLTQLGTFPKFLGDLASDVNRFGFQWGDYGHLVALSIMIYFTLGGFWLGYVGTRTLLTGLLDGFSREKIAKAAAPENLQIGPDDKIKPASLALRAIDAALLAAPLESLQNPDDVVAWAAAQARSGNLSVAQTALEGALASRPDDPDIGRQLIKVYLAQQKRQKAVELARKLPDSPPKMLAMLYDAPPGGFTAAIDIGERLVRDSKFQQNDSVQVWLASAYGQQYTFEKNLGHQDKLPEIEKQVEKHVAAAVDIDPTTRSLLLSLWRPEEGSTEDDLKDIPQDNAVLARVLTPTVQEPARNG